MAGPADLIFRGGKVLTVDPAFRIAEAVAVRGGRIAAIGTDAEIGTRAERVIDLGGRTVVPGLIDGHAHLDREGLRPIRPSLAGLRSIAAIQTRIAALARERPKGEWIVTMPIGDPPHYWGVPEGLAEGRYPMRQDLDAAAPNHPVWIAPVWGYWREAPKPETLVSIANSRALAAAGIGPDTLPPTASVTIERGADGAPTGRFIERTTASVVEHTLMAAAPGFTASERRAGLRRAMAAYNATGTTAVFEGHGVAGEVIEAYKALHAEDALGVRAHLVFSPSWGAADGADPARLVEGWASWLAGAGVGDSMLRLAGLFAEIGGGEDGRARASSAPYTGWAGFHYDSSLGRETLLQVLHAAARANIRVAGLSLALLPLYEMVDAVTPIAGRRWVIEHPGIFTPDQIARLARLGVVITPLTGRYIEKEGNAPGSRADNPADDRFMPLKSLVRAGVAVALETDNVPTSLFSPIWHVVARRDRFGNPVAPAGQRLDRREALRLATMGGAWLLGRERALGSLEPGKRADLAVLDTDYLACPEDRIKDIRADLTLVGGRIVHEA